MKFRVLIKFIEIMHSQREFKYRAIVGGSRKTTSGVKQANEVQSVKLVWQFCTKDGGRCELANNDVPY
jgi:hypothetical protein